MTPLTTPTDPSASLPPWTATAHCSASLHLFNDFDMVRCWPADDRHLEIMHPHRVVNATVFVATPTEAPA